MSYHKADDHRGDDSPQDEELAGNRFVRYLLKNEDRCSERDDAAEYDDEEGQI